MAAGDIVFARFPIILNSGSSADVSLTTALTNFFPISTYTVIHTELVFDSGTKTKGIIVVVAQDNS